MSDGDFKLTKLPMENVVEIIKHSDTESKLQLARVSKGFQDIIFSSYAAVIWSELEVTVTCGTRTLPFLAKIRTFARSLLVNVGSDAFGREGNLPEFPILTQLTLRAMPPTYKNLDACLTSGLRSAFPALRELRLDGKVSAAAAGQLPSIFPGLLCLQLGSDVGISSINDAMNDLISRLPALTTFELEGTWWIFQNFTTPDRFDTTLQTLGSLQKASVHGVYLDTVVDLLDKMAESTIANTVRVLSFIPPRQSFLCTPATPVLSFRALTTLKLIYGHLEQYITMFSWLSDLRGIETLETLSIHAHFTTELDFGSAGSFWANAECLPPRLSTISLGVGGLVVGAHVMRAIVRRSNSLKNVVITTVSRKAVRLIGFDALISGLCNEASSIEYLSIAGGGFPDPELGDQEVRRACSHLMAHAHHLSRLKFLHFDIYRDSNFDENYDDERPPARHDFTAEGCSVEALQQRLPAADGECLVKVGRGPGPIYERFSDAEKAFVCRLDGYVQTGYPFLG